MDRPAPAPFRDSSGQRRTGVFPSKKESVAESPAETRRLEADLVEPLPPGSVGGIRGALPAVLRPPVRPGVADVGLEGGRRGSAPGDFPAGVPQTVDVQRRIGARHLALSSRNEPVPRLSTQPRGADGWRDRLARYHPAPNAPWPIHARRHDADATGSGARHRELPDGCREVFLLHDVEGLEHREMGGILGIAEGTSKSQVHKARLRIRAYLAGSPSSRRQQAEHELRGLRRGDWRAHRRHARSRTARRCSISIWRRAQSCRALVADLRRIRQTAGTLDRRLRRLKSGPACRRGFRPNASSACAASNTWRLSVALAAATLLLVTRGVRRVAHDHRPPPSQTVASSTPPPAEAPRPPGRDVQSVETELRLAAEHYENAIAGLEVIARTQQTTIDPQLSATLQKNLAVIDQAIDESRAALREQPANLPAQESLFEAFRSKVALLQDTVSLVNEMRKGNQAEAARIVGGLVAMTRPTRGQGISAMRSRFSLPARRRPCTARRGTAGGRAIGVSNASGPLSAPSGGPGSRSRVRAPRTRSECPGRSRSAVAALSISRTSPATWS